MEHYIAKQNLHAVKSALFSYAESNNNYFPQNIEKLVPYYFDKNILKYSVNYNFNVSWKKITEISDEQILVAENKRCHHSYVSKGESIPSGHYVMPKNKDIVFIKDE